MSENGGKTRTVTSKNLGGGVTGYKSVTTYSDGSSHVTHALSTGLHASHSVSKTGKASKVIYGISGEKKSHVSADW